MGVSCEKLELVSLGAFLFPSLCLFTWVFIIRSSCEASLMVTWPLHAHTLFIRVPLWRGLRNVTRERQMKGSREREREGERETESLLAAMLKVCSSYSVE